MKPFLSLVRPLLSLIKSLQTALLLVTGMAGFLSASPLPVDWLRFAGLAGSLFLAISGSTILNMWYDRDIDARMERTLARPLVSGKVRPGLALRLGLAFATAGSAWALTLSPSYGLVVLAGLFLDVVVYTIWLKRRTPWSIVWGGLSGGMPVLAGRVLATGQVDEIGLLLAAAVLFWIPTHILTFSLRFSVDYLRAGIPTFPSAYGEALTLKVIVLSSVLAALSISAASIWIGITAGALGVLAVLSTGLLILSLSTWFRPSERANFNLFKFASIYMLSAMLLLAFQAF